MNDSVFWHREKKKVQNSHCKNLMNNVLVQLPESQTALSRSNLK